MKIYLDSIGCRLNQSEIEMYARQFVAEGHELSPTPEQADIALVNTCAVTHNAAGDSRNKIRHFGRVGVNEIIVTGCWSTLHQKEAEKYQGVTRVIPNHKKDTLVPEILGLPPTYFDIEPIARIPVPGIRSRTRAFIKVQDGCNNHCTYCVTRIARGKGRSLPEQSVLKEIHSAIAGGAQEIVISGVHLGSWGHDLHNKKQLSDLVRLILGETDVVRLRLSSLEPWDLKEDFLLLWGDKRLCRHLHLPLQSGSKNTLRRMARNITPVAFQSFVNEARRCIPDLSVTTDIIVGFPGESEDDFIESLEFLQEINFSGAHVFTYSPRPGTPAYEFPERIEPAVSKNRSRIVRDLIDKSSQSFQQKFIGKQLHVLWEGVSELGPQGWILTGLTDNYLRVNAASDVLQWNQITPTLITQLTKIGLTGTILSEQTP